MSNLFSQVPRTSGIYKIENKLNQKVYIGQSKDIRRRFYYHVNGTGCNPHLYRSFQKYGLENFTFEILKETYDLDYWEKLLIAIYKANDPQYGYNIESGGKRGTSNSTRKPSPLKGKPSPLKGRPSPLKGRKLGPRGPRSEAVKQKISESKKGVKLSKEHIENIIKSKQLKGHFGGGNKKRVSPHN